MPVIRATLHHEGVGAPTDVTRGAAGGYSAWIGTSRYTILRSPYDSYATKHYNHVSFDICLSGNRHVGRNTYPVTGADILLVRDACAYARARGWLVDYPTIYPHRESYNTACPGDQTMAVWDDLVRACCVQPQPDPVPPAWKVPPMYNPSLQVAAVLKNEHGNVVAGVSPDGHVYAWGIPFDHDHIERSQPYGNEYWNGRQAARMEWPNAAEERAGYTHIVIATSEERYGQRGPG